MPKLPAWLIKRTPKAQNIRSLRALVDDEEINTVCESAKCPNIGECYSSKTMTFMILGDICTRDCRFCAVEPGKPMAIDPHEPQRVAAAAKKLGLSYVVITSVTRDDLPDGGATQFVETIHSLRASMKGIMVEVLIPDFKGDEGFLKMVINARPDVINHNIETVPRLYSQVRPQADYKRSLRVLKHTKDADKNICTKSGLMVGLGENFEEVRNVLRDLRGVGCEIVTIGQYISPTSGHAPVIEYVRPETFEEYRKIGIEMGFRSVFSGPFVRSSYQAQSLLKRD